MKTLTEFSTLTLRKAAAARAAVGGAPRPVAAAPEAPASETPAEGEAPAEAAAPEAAAPDPAIEGVASALGVQADRAARLLEALDVVGTENLDNIRLVRVFQGETGPHNAVSRGEFHYVVDRVAGAGGQRRRDDRGERRGGGDRGGRGGGGDRGRSGGGGGGFGGDRGPPKPRGLGSLKVGAPKEEPKEDDRPGRGEMPRAGIGWQLTAAPREMREGRGGGRGGPGGPRRDRRGPGGPGGDRPRGPRGEGRGFGGPGGGGPGGGRGRGPRGEGRGFGGPGGGGGGGAPQLDANGNPIPGTEQQARGPRPPRQGGDARPPRQDQGPRLGPDGLPLPPRPRRERKPIGPDANGLGPDGLPWDPERRAKRQAEREARRPEGDAANAPVNTGAAVEGAPTDASKE